MSPFPFRKDDWDRVKDASIALVNAELAEDPALAAAQFAELQVVLGELRSKYGEHPILLETEADFCDDDQVAVALYEKAMLLARHSELPFDSIQSSLEALLVQMGRKAQHPQGSWLPLHNSEFQDQKKPLSVGSRAFLLTSKSSRRSST